MTSHSHKNSGITLIEAIIYATLLSLLMVGILQFVYDIHIQDMDLINEINDIYGS